MKVELAGKVLNENQALAAELRRRFSASGTFVLNLISSPGSGKTALLEQTLAGWKRPDRVAVLTGDIQTDADARRLARYGFPVRQINTAGACHLDARMVTRALEDWNPGSVGTLFIENVGNLVCPTSYDLGEHAKVVVLSVTEGEEKPLKYPGIFHTSELMVLNKVDLLSYVPFDIGQARANARQVNPEIGILELSCTTGLGLQDWFHWIEKRRAGA